MLLTLLHKMFKQLLLVSISFYNSVPLMADSCCRGSLEKSSSQTALSLHTAVRWKHQSLGLFLYANVNKQNHEHIVIANHQKK